MIPLGTWTYTQALRDAGFNVGIVGYHCGANLPDKFGADDDTWERKTLLPTRSTSHGSTNTGFRQLRAT